LYIKLYGNLFLSNQPAFGRLAPVALKGGIRCPVQRRANRRFWLRTPETWGLFFFHRNLPSGRLY